MQSFLIMAQSAETAEKGLDLLERVQAGGIPLVCLVIATICGLAFYWQLKANKRLNELALEKAEARETAEKAATKERLKDQESLLREMLDRDREAQESQQAASAAVEGFSEAQQAAQRALESMSLKVANLEDAIRRCRGEQPRV